ARDHDLLDGDVDAMHTLQPFDDGVAKDREPDGRRVAAALARRVERCLHDVEWRRKVGFADLEMQNVRLSPCQVEDLPDARRLDACCGGRRRQWQENPPDFGAVTTREIIRPPSSTASTKVPMYGFTVAFS